MKKFILLFLFPIVSFANDTTNGLNNVGGYVGCIKDNVLKCVNEKCIPGATTGANDSVTKECVDKCKVGIEEKCKELQQKPE